MRSILAEQPASPATRHEEMLAKAARFTPLAIVIYFAVQLAVRLCLSPNLEVDDAEMVGQIHWALGYPNSHPPLYHWIVRLCYEAFDSWAAATAVPKFALLAAGYSLVFDAARRVASSAVTGALAVAALAFIPVVVWKTEGKLTHSVLGFTATAALVHAFCLVLIRGKTSDFAWLGSAAAVGVLAKYNFLLVLAALLVTIVILPDARRAFRSRAALLSILISATLTAPHLWWIAAHPRHAGERLYMLKTGGGPLGLSLPANSLADGLLSLSLVVLVSVAPALLVFTAAGAWSRKSETITDKRLVRLERVLGVFLLAELVAFVVAVISGGFTQVHERYLVVLLPPLPIWLALRLRNAGGVPTTLALACVVLAAVTVMRPISVMRGNSRLGFPYARWATEITNDTAAPFAIAADRPENAGNIAMHLPAQPIFDPDQPAERVLLVADDTAGLQRARTLLGARYSPNKEPQLLKGSLRWKSEREVSVVTQLLERRD